MRQIAGCERRRQQRGALRVARHIRERIRLREHSPSLRRRQVDVGNDDERAQLGWKTHPYMRRSTGGTRCCNDGTAIERAERVIRMPFQVAREPSDLVDSEPLSPTSRGNDESEQNRCSARSQTLAQRNRIAHEHTRRRQSRRDRAHRTADRLCKSAVSRSVRPLDKFQRKALCRIHPRFEA